MSSPLPPPPWNDPDLCQGDGATGGARGTPGAEVMIPFAVSAEAAQVACLAWMESGFGHPRDLRETARLEAPQAVLLPVWLWSGRARSRWSATSIYQRTQTKTVREQGPARPLAAQQAAAADTKEVEIVERVPTPTQGEHEETYPAIWIPGFTPPSWQVSGARLGQSDFDVGRAVPFNHADANNASQEPLAVSRDAARQQVCAQMREAESKACTEQMPGDEVQDPVVTTRVVSLEDRLVHLPVWLASYTYGGKTYRCVVNGQSGQAAGEAPTDPKRVAMAWAIALVILIIIVAVWFFLGRGGG